MSEPILAYLDTNVFIFGLEGTPERSEPIGPLFRRLPSQPNRCMTSELTLAEVLVGPLRSRDLTLERYYLDLFTYVTLVPCSRDVCLEAAGLAASHRPKLRVLDAIHLATAVRSGCRAFVTADLGIRPPAPIRKIAPDAAGIGELLDMLA
jgi:predicted nucleic acid-binding protein